MALTRRGKEALERMRIRDVNLQLLLRDPTADLGNDPWDGQSPRDLTEARNSFILGHEGASLNAESLRIEEQCRRHLYGW